MEPIVARVRWLGQGYLRRHAPGTLCICKLNELKPVNREPSALAQQIARNDDAVLRTASLSSPSTALVPMITQAVTAAFTPMFERIDLLVREALRSTSSIVSPAASFDLATTMNDAMDDQNFDAVPLSPSPPTSQRELHLPPTIPEDRHEVLYVFFFNFVICTIC